MRLFIGSYARVEFYDEIRRDLSCFFEGKWVEPRNLHLTWYFLGDLPDAAPIIDRLQPLKLIPRLPLAIQGIGTFGKPQPKVLYLKTAQVVPTILHEKIAELIEREPESDFRPHITLARIKRGDTKALKRIERPWMSEPLGEVEPDIYLIESRLTPNGPIYIPLEKF